MFYKMKNGLCPDYLPSLVPAIFILAPTYLLRNFSDLQTLHTNYRLYYTSFLPSAVRDWNELPEQTRNAPSPNIFKNRLKSNLITPPRYYNIAKRLGQIYCSCGDIEGTHHFLFVCHQFTDLRRDLINSVTNIRQPNLNVLLCGDISLILIKISRYLKLYNIL